jgi:hypothetical protein
MSVLQCDVLRSSLERPRTGARAERSMLDREPAVCSSTVAQVPLPPTPLPPTVVRQVISVVL